MAEISPILKELLQPGRLAEPEIRVRLGRIKEVSNEYGCVQVAREIRDTVERFPENGADGTPYKKNRGFELACDLTLQHARKLLRGPNVAAALPEVLAIADEVLECLFAAGKLVKGIELNIDLSDTVLRQVCEGEGPCDDLMKTAHDIVARTMERTLAADEATRGVRSGSPDTDAPRESTDVNGVPANMLDYLARVCERVRAARRRMTGLERIAEPTARLRFLAVVAEESAAANVWSLAAAALDESATMMQARNPNESAALSRRALGVRDRAAAEADAVGFKLLSHKYRHRGA